MFTAEQAIAKMDQYRETRQDSLYKKILKEAESEIQFNVSEERGWCEVHIKDLDERRTEALVQEFAYNGYDVYMRMNLNARYMLFKWAGSKSDYEFPAGAVLRKKSINHMKEDYDKATKIWQDELEIYGAYCAKKGQEEKPAE